MLTFIKVIGHFIVHQSTMESPMLLLLCVALVYCLAIIGAWCLSMSGRS